MAAPSSLLAWTILMDRGAWRAAVHGGHSQMRLSTGADIEIELQRKERAVAVCFLTSGRLGSGRGSSVNSSIHQ